MTPSSITDDQSVVFSNIRQALAGKSDRTPLPDWEDAAIVCRPPRDFATPSDQFRFKFEAAGGIVVEGWAGLTTWLQQQNLQRGYVDPACASALAGTPFEIETSFDRSRVDDYQFGITRAAAAIAETGSLVLNETQTSSRLGALAPWVHIAIVESSQIVPSMPSAIAQFGMDRATLFVTGPSKTADVEGILIKGVHGPGIQVCCLV